MPCPSPRLHWIGRAAVTPGSIFCRCERPCAERRSAARHLLFPVGEPAHRAAPVPPGCLSTQLARRRAAAGSGCARFGLRPVRAPRRRRRCGAIRSAQHRIRRCGQSGRHAVIRLHRPACRAHGPHLRIRFCARTARTRGAETLGRCSPHLRIRFCARPERASGSDSARAAAVKSGVFRGRCRPESPSRLSASRARPSCSRTAGSRSPRMRRSRLGRGPCDGGIRRRDSARRPPPR